jgi:hypothetical protein
MCIEIEPQVWTSVISTPSQIWQGGKWSGEGDGSKEIRVHGINALTWEQGSGRNYTACIIHSFVAFSVGIAFADFLSLFIGGIITNISYWLFTAPQ